jgi:hypothetical protein
VKKSTESKLSMSPPLDRGDRADARLGFNSVLSTELKPT